jgi:hypothetical protein
MENFDLKGYLKENKLNKEAFQYDPSIDYLEQYELLPTNIQNYVMTWDDDLVNGDVKNREEMVANLEKMGWTIEYDFGPDSLYGLRPIGTDSDFM